jgi:hypothetical protein
VHAVFPAPANNPGEKIMFKKIRPQDNSANINNANKGSSGTNRQYDQGQGNRGKQLNPNKKP